MSFLRSSWAESPINLDDNLNSGAWAKAGSLDFQGGKILALNDAHFAYIAFDLLQDKGNDAGTGDYFWLTFDRNRNRSITANYDVNYGLYPGHPNKMGRQYYLGANRWTGLLNESSQAECRIEFGPSPNSEEAHRIWKIRIPIADLNVSLATQYTPYTKFGVRVKSSTPGFVHDTPSNFSSDFSALHYLLFAKQPGFPAGTEGPVIGGVGLIPFTKINNGRATTDPGYYVQVKDAAFGGRLNLIGNRVTLQQLWANGARRYRVLHREGSSGSFSPIRSNWNNYRWTGSDYVLQPWGPNDDDLYVLPNPALDYSIDDLLFQFNSISYAPGIHEFKMEFFQSNGTTSVASDPQILQLLIDNNLPEVNIDEITHNGKLVNACAIVNLKDDLDGLRFKVTAHDPQGNLHSWSLSAAWGAGQSETIFSQNYDSVSHPPQSWQGVQNLAVPASGEWVPDETCAYTFRVTAFARTTNGYSSQIGRSTTFKNLTLIKPTPTLTISPTRIFPYGG